VIVVRIELADSTRFDVRYSVVDAEDLLGETSPFYSQFEVFSPNSHSYCWSASNRFKTSLS
jgi:hypothetical protein